MVGGTTLADWLRDGVAGLADRADALLGLAFTLDPSAFILGDGVLTGPAPPPGPQRIAGLGTLAQSGRHSLRLYPAGGLDLPGTAFVEIADGASGPTACAYAVAVAEPLTTPDAMTTWVLPPSGRLGQGALRLPDGPDFQRTSPPGPSWVTPATRYERVATDGPTRSRRHFGTLYHRATGLADPAPAAECLWAEQVEERGASWLVLATGVALPPGAIAIG